MKKFLIAALALVLVTVAASAQNNRNRQRSNPAEMYSTMADNLAKQLKLKKEIIKIGNIFKQFTRRFRRN